MERFTVIVAEPIQAMLVKIWSYIPTVALAIAILVIGWGIAKVLEIVLVRALKVIRLDSTSEKAGISKILAQGEIKVALSELIGVVVYWLVMLVTIASVLSVMGLTFAAEILAKLAAYVPNLLGAMFILVLGMFLAAFISSVVLASAANAGIKRSKLIAQLTKIVLVVFAVLMAIEQLGIGVAIINLAISITLISIGLGLGLAFGLGCKDIAAKAMQGWLDKINK